MAFQGLGLRARGLAAQEVWGSLEYWCLACSGSGAELSAKNFRIFTSW